MKTHTLGYGLIGCGVIAHHHAKAIAKDDAAQLVAVADIRESVAQAMALEYDVPEVYTDAQALLADDAVDAVILALPAGVRFDIALSALATGKHVLLEKPVARNMAEFDQIRASACHEGQVVGVCSSRLSLLEPTQVAARAIADGAIGQLRLIRVRGLTAAKEKPQSPPPWRLNRSLNGGGIMANWGCYDLDIVMSAVSWSLRPHTVLGQTWDVSPPVADYIAPDSDAETHVAATILCDNQVAIQFERGELLSQPAESTWQFVGTQGVIALDAPGSPGVAPVQLFTYDSPHGTQTRTLLETVTENDAGHALIHNFTQSVSQQQSPQTSLARAGIIQQITDAVYQSTRTGQPVTLADADANAVT